MPLLTNDKRKGTLPIISIVVCTYNRAHILSECLGSLAEQSIPDRKLQMIIIDNNSSDSTKNIAMDFASRFPQFKVYFEREKGLSHARNRGWRESSTEWIVYIDDDAKVASDYCNRLLYVIEHYPFDCFGGVYTPWYLYGKPCWFRDEYASNISVQRHTGILQEGFVSGGNFAIRRSLLEKFGGFRSDLGMRPGKIAYGEETLLQMKLRDAGYTIGFDPHLVVEHLVSREKLSPWWHVRSAYAQGRDYSRCINTLSFYSLLRTFLSVIYNFFHDTRKATPLLLTKNYYWENWIMDVLRPFALQSGCLTGSIHSA